MAVNPVQSSRLRTINWRVPGPLTDPVDLTDRDLDIFWLLARNLYSTTKHVVSAGFDTEQSTHTRLLKLEKAGYVGGAMSIWNPRRRIMVWSLADPGAEILREYDPDRWSTYFDGWHSPVNQVIGNKRSLVHELRRNDWCGRMEQLFRGSSVDADWMPGSAGHVRAYPGGGTTRVELTPDAVFWVNHHYWMVEYERSWRVNTLEDKIYRYGQFYKYRLWEQKMRVAPSVIFVLAPKTTQHSAFDNWVHSFTDDLGINGWFVQDQPLEAGDLQHPVVGYHWSAIKRKMVRDCWYHDNLNAHHDMS